MKKLFPLLLILLTACSGPKSFSVTMEGDPLGTQLLTVVYTLPDGNRAVVQPTAMDGRVEFEGSSSEPSLVEVFATSGAPIVQFTAQNGDKISIRWADGQWVISGEQASSPAPAADSGSPKQSFAAPEVVVQRDSVETFPTEGVWVFTSAAEERTPALLDSLRHYGKRARDIYFGTSMEDWRYVTRRDSASWKQGLLPQGPVAVPAVTHTPLLLEVDSAGTIIRQVRL